MAYSPADWKAFQIDCRNATTHDEVLSLIVDMIDGLDEEDQHFVLRSFCDHCRHRQDPNARPCQCWNDE